LAIHDLDLKNLNHNIIINCVLLDLSKASDCNEQVQQVQITHKEDKCFKV